MHFWLVDVKSTVNVNGVDVAFDYMNTYYDEKRAIKEAELLTKDENVLEVSVHHWMLQEDGTQVHVEDNDYGVSFFFTNKNHREDK